MTFGSLTAPPAIPPEATQRLCSTVRSPRSLRTGGRPSFRSPPPPGESCRTAANDPYADTAERPPSGVTARLLALYECLAEQFDLVVSVLPVKLPQQLLLQRHMIMLPKYTQRARRRHNEQLRDLAGQDFVVEPCSN
jgi:hypothetical protein